MHLMRLLRALKFQWVSVINAILLLAAQLYLYYLQQQPASDQVDAMKSVLHANNSSMLWYLLIGSGFYLFYRYKEKKAGYTGQFMSSFWIPLSAWVFGMLVTTVMTMNALLRLF